MTKSDYKVGSLVTLVNNNGMVGYNIGGGRRIQYQIYNIGDNAVVLRILYTGMLKVRWLKNNKVDSYWRTSRFKPAIQHKQLVF